MAQANRQLVAGNWNGSGRQGNWELVNKCPTMELARQTVTELTAAGVEATIAMVDGLCVIARVHRSSR